jgi:DivIVA domain-containing protein
MTVSGSVTAQTAPLPLLDELVTAPAFRVAFRGYDAHEVDRYAGRVEAEIEALLAAQRDLAAEARSLAEQLDRAREELAVLRRRPTVNDTIGFQHLGPRVEQILADAQAEADELRRSAVETTRALRARTEAHVRRVESEHQRTLARLAAKRQWLVEEEARWSRHLASRQRAVARAEDYRRRVRENAEELIEAATTQHERLVLAALRRSEHIVAQARVQAASIRHAARLSGKVAISGG